MILIRIQQIGQKPDYCLWRFWKNIINLPPPPQKKKKNKKKKTYDYHTAFDIKPAKVVYNVDLDMNDKKITGILLDESNVDSAATVEYVNYITKISNTLKCDYSEFFDEVIDFTNATSYKLTQG